MNKNQIEIQSMFLFIIINIKLKFIQNNKIKILKSKPLLVERGNIIVSFSILQHKIRLRNKSFKDLFHCFVCSTKKNTIIDKSIRKEQRGRNLLHRKINLELGNKRSPRLILEPDVTHLSSAIFSKMACKQIYKK